MTAGNGVPKIVPGTVTARQCHACGGIMPNDGPAMIIGVVRSGMQKAFLIVLCPTCGQARLGDLQCVTCSRGDVAQLFDTLAKDGGVHVGG